MTATTTTAVWPSRIADAVKALSLKKNAGASIPMHECPKPKTATGTADRIRKSGLVPDGYVCHSRGAQVCLARADANAYRPLPGAGVSDPAKRAAMGLGPVTAKAAPPSAAAKAAAKTAAPKKAGTKTRADGTAAARPRIRRRAR